MDAVSNFTVVWRGLWLNNLTQKVLWKLLWKLLIHVNFGPRVRR
jgi:hypothetical protein